MEPPTKKKIQLAKISELVEKVDLVEARDKFLFAPEKVPKVDDSLQAMEDWVICVKASIKRADRTSQRRR